MRYAHEVGKVRAAERELMARLPEGTLMRRAAAGLAATCARLLRGDPASGTGAGVYGARIVLLVGGGDNGGDALYAGAALAHRGARVTAILAGSRTHEAGLAALRAAGGRAVPATGGDAETTGTAGAGAAATGSATGSGAGAGAGAGAEGWAEAAVAAATAAMVEEIAQATASERSGTLGPTGTGGRPAGAEPPATARAGAALAPEPVAEIAAADLIIDGMLGIGGRGGLRDPYAALARGAAVSPAVVVACDVPSGVDASTGQVEGVAVRADLTVTFGTYKPGLLIDPGAEHAGVVELVDIGLGPYLPDPDVCAPRADDVAAWLPRPTNESNKYRRGVLGVLAGGERFTGAAVLSAGGAVRGGAGMVRFASSEHPVELVRHRWPETVATVIGDSIKDVGRVQAWVAGPGLGTDERAEALLAEVLGTDLPVLVDADGLTILARRRDLLWRNAPTVLTPHAGELARLLGTEPEEVEARRLEHVRRAADELVSTVLLKGSTTLIAEAERPVRVNPTGTPWLATAGSGDVLSGLIGALLAGGPAPIDAAAAGAYLHGMAARLAADPHGDGAAPISAYDVVDALPAAFRTVSA